MAAIPAKPKASGDPHAGDSARKVIYKVVVNHEEQYSLWPAERENPAGWRDAGKKGTQEQCQNYIREVWTDMRPLSIRAKEK